MNKVLSLALCGAFLISCTGDPNDPRAFNKQGAGTVIGGISGAVIGSQFGKGSGAMVGTAIGAIAGAAIGNNIGASMDAQDRVLSRKSTQYSLERVPVGEVTEWKNPDSGHRGTVTPVRTFQNRHGQYCREYNQTVTIGGKTEKAYGKACREPDGSWKIVS